MDEAEQKRKVRENRLRRMAARQQLRLMKSARKDRLAVDFGKYMLSNLTTGEIVVGNKPHLYSMTLDEVEAFLLKPRR